MRVYPEQVQGLLSRPVAVLDGGAGPNADPGPCAGDLAATQAQEYLQLAYVRAVAATARCTVRSETEDVNGIDVTLVHQMFDGDYYVYSELDLQLKTTSQAGCLNDDSVAIKLQKTHYDKLRTPNVSAPRLLVVMRLPSDPALWLESDEEALRLSHCVYWMSLRGMGPIDTATKTVHVPRANVFDVNSLHELMYKSRQKIDLAS